MKTPRQSTTFNFLLASFVTEHIIEKCENRSERKINNQGIITISRFHKHPPEAEAEVHV